MVAALLGPSGRTVLRGTTFVIGTAQDNQLVVNDVNADPRHAEIRFNGQDYTITDLDSTNGTFINEQRLAPTISYILTTRESIRIGYTAFTFEVSGAVSAASSHDAPRDAERESEYSSSDADEPTYILPKRGVAEENQLPPPPPPYTVYPPPLENPYEPSLSGPTTVSPSRTSRRGLWVVLSSIVIALVVTAGIFSYSTYVNSVKSLPTAMKTLDAFCTSLQGRNYHAAYSQLSHPFQIKLSESLFTSFYTDVTSCIHSTPVQAGNSATASLTTSSFNRTNKDTLTLIQGNTNAWTIDDDANLSGLTKTMAIYCSAIQSGDDQTAYSLFSSKLLSKLSEAQFMSFFPKAASCSSDTLTMGAQGAMMNLTTVSPTGQTEDNPASLVQDSSGTWKIDDFASLPDKTLDTFCTALQQKDYQTDYNQFSAGIQQTVTESQFVAGFLSNNASCSHDSAAELNGSVIANMLFTANSGQKTLLTAFLIIDGSTSKWKIDKLVNLPAETLAKFCTYLDHQDYQTAYDQLSPGLQSTLTQAQFATAYSSVTSCIYSVPLASGSAATATITFSMNSKQTVHDKAVLIEERNGDWKIDNLSKQHE